MNGRQRNLMNAKIKRNNERLKLWWQQYLTSLSVRDLREFHAADFCWTECTYLVGYGKVTDAFAKQFWLIILPLQGGGRGPITLFCCPLTFHNCLLLPNYVHFSKAIKHLRPSKSVRCNGTPGLMIKICSTVFTPLLKYTFNLSLLQQHLSAQWKKKKKLLCLIWKEGNTSSIINYSQTSLVYYFSKTVEFVKHCSGNSSSKPPAATLFVAFLTESTARPIFIVAQRRLLASTT